MSQSLNLLDCIFYHLCKCHDEGFLPDIDHLDDRFPDCDWDDIEQIVKSFVSIHDLSETKIYWEGDLSEVIRIGTAV